MFTKKFLAYTEMSTIINACLETDDLLLRKMIKDMFVLKYCTDLDIPDEIESDLYDKYVEDGTVSEISVNVKNYNLIDTIIAEYESPNRVIAEFVDMATTAMNKLTDSIPKNTRGWNNLFDKVNGIIDKSVNMYKDK